MKVDYKNMKKEQLDLINEYCEDNLRKLKQICKLVWGKKQFQTCYHDDLYDDAMKVLFGDNETAKSNFLKDMNMTLQEGRSILTMNLPSPYGETGTLKFENYLKLNYNIYRK